MDKKMQVGTKLKTGSERRGRGRPREFDEGEVLASVLSVFWQKGYSGASLPDLSEAAGVTRPSLYAALGDKLSMYLRALDVFKKGLQEQLKASLNPSRTLAEGLLSFYLAAIDMYLSGGRQPRGCLVFCTAPADAMEEPAIRTALLETLKILDAGFEERFRIATKAGEVRAHTDVRQAAAMASAVLHSLALRARTGQKREGLTAFAAAATSMLVGACVRDSAGRGER